MEILSSTKRGRRISKILIYRARKYLGGQQNHAQIALNDEVGWCRTARREPPSNHSGKFLTRLQQMDEDKILRENPC